MGSRIEWIALIAIIMVLTEAGFSVKKIKNSVENVSALKTAEFENATLYEVNQSTLINVIKMKRAEQIDQSWYLKKVEMITPEVKSLKAQKAEIHKLEIVLEGNVNVLKRNGTVYKSENAYYNRPLRILRTVGPFEGFKAKNYVKGKNLYYDMENKISYADDVYGNFVLKKSLP